MKEEEKEVIHNIIDLYSEDFVSDSVWEEICDQAGVDVLKTDKITITFDKIEINK